MEYRKDTLPNTIKVGQFVRMRPESLNTKTTGKVVWLHPLGRFALVEFEVWKTMPWLGADGRKVMVRNTIRECFLMAQKAPERKKRIRPAAVEKPAEEPAPQAIETQPTGEPEIPLTKLVHYDPWAISKKRTELLLSRAELAAMSGIKENTVEAIEQQRVSRTRYRNIVLLAKALGCTASALMPA